MGKRGMFMKISSSKRIIRELGSPNRIRLVYVYLEKFISRMDYRLGETYGITSPFTLPDGMTMEDVCKVISYLSEKSRKRKQYKTSQRK